MPVTTPPRIAARNAVSRFLQIASGNAQSQIADLTDDEVNEIVAAAADKETARQQIKDVFSRAYDRRRESAAGEVKEVMTAGQREAVARKVLERELGLTPTESIDAVGKLSAEQLEALGKLEPEYGCDEACQAILDAQTTPVAQEGPALTEAVANEAADDWTESAAADAADRAAAAEDAADDRAAVQAAERRAQAKNFGRQGRRS